MKRKAAVMALICAMAMVLSIGVAQAAQFTCTVNGVGVTDQGYYYTTLTDTGATFSNVPFILFGPGINTAVGNQMFATALTASSKGSNLLVDVPNTTAWSIVTLVNAL